MSDFTWGMCHAIIAHLVAALLGPQYAFAPALMAIGYFMRAAVQESRK